MSRNLLLSALLVFAGFSNSLPPAAAQQCTDALHSWNETQHKDVYRVGVLAIRGFEAAYDEFNSTFSDYLTATAGRRFDKPVRFELKPLNFQLLFTDTEAGNVDFIYVNPSAYSCIESEYGANSLVSQVSKRIVEGVEYDLTAFGGVIFTRADSNVYTVQDIEGTRVACASISGLGSGQMQFRLLQQRGLSYINDPDQMVFTSNQGKVVNGVLSGEFDVGYVRTDQIERTIDATTGELVDKSLLRIIEPVEGLEIGGEPFPFQSSTQLYPEWNVAALTHVHDDVATAVQGAMHSLDEHAAVGEAIVACYDANNCADGDDDCRTACELDANITANRCDTTVEVALKAHKARTDGQYSAFRSTLSYMELRNMQEETGFISKRDDGVWQCIRSSAIYDAIVCPPGHFKRSELEVAIGCDSMGLSCGDGFQCVCKPCVKGFDVDVFPVDSDGIGCAKLDICGTTEQRNSITFIAVDNKKRANLTLDIILQEGTSSYQFEASPISTPFPGNNSSNIFEFTVESERVGVVLIEILADGEQIPESPLRLEVTARDCQSEYGDALREPNAVGECVCGDNSVEIGGKCVSYSVLFPSILVPLVVLSALAVFIYVDRKRKQADSLWEVKTSELFFGDPPEILGRGTFGLVLLAEYRGTQVAVKRVIPPRAKKTKRGDVRSSGSRDDSVQYSEESLDVESSKMMRRKSLDITGSEAFDFKDDDTTAAPGLKPLHPWSLGTSRSFEPIVDKSQGDNNLEPRKRAARRSSAPHSIGPETVDLDDLETGTLAPSVMERRHSMNITSISGTDANKPCTRSVAFNKTGDTSTACATAMVNSSMTGTTSLDIGRYLKQSGSLLDSFAESGIASFDRVGRFGRILRFGRRDEYARLKADFRSEMRHLSKLRHPCITTVMGAVISKKEEPMLVMEYMDHGSLYDILHNETMVIEGELVLPILRDIAQGMRFLHAASPQVIHGDLKAQNVLVDSKFRAKVADFGLSQKRQVGATGTPLWMAPELLRGESENTAFSDVYSFGIILYEVYSRKEPYQGENLRDVLRQVADPKINKRPPVPSSCPSAVATLMADCLVGQPESRPSFEELDLRLKRLDVANVEPRKMIFSHQIRKDRRTSELLDEVFPKHVADALREGRRVDPEYRDCVTIFFSDIVGFTEISSQLPPMKVSQMIDRLYIRFDRLSHEHDVFKVETIGDAYMAATNLVKDQEDHVKRIVDFARDAIEAASETLIDLDDHSRGCVKIRVGFHSGPIVANVVGSRNPRYSLFGDTVNTASRMESTSLEGQIQCSDRSAALLQKHHPEISITSRGEIRVKGKGEMETFWVNLSDHSTR